VSGKTVGRLIERRTRNVESDVVDRTDLTLRGPWSSKVEVRVEDALTAEIVQPAGDTLTISRDFTGTSELVLRPAS